jgi:hypothetical protein
MKKSIFLTLIFIAIAFKNYAQVSNTGMVEQMDSIENGKLNISGYVDVYYGFDFNQPKSFNRPYSVSSSRHNEVNINLVYVDLKYKNEKVRARIIPGFGSYVNSNYANENGSLKNLIEANVGLKLFKNKEIWIDAGVIGSPYTNESAISKDHFMYTRSFAPEYVPYYLSGAKLSVPIGKKVIAYLYLLNGWQQISDVNNPLSVGTQIEYRPNNKLLLNWNTYIGDESSSLTPNYGNRYFTDVYAIYNPNGKFSFTSCAYLGFQQCIDSITGNKYFNNWWQANFIAKYKYNNHSFIAGRVEYFNDKNEVLVKPITNTNGFSTFSTAICYTKKITQNALFRIEARNYLSENNIYLNAEAKTSNTSNLLITNITIWF